LTAKGKLKAAQFKKIDRAKHVLSQIKGTPRTQRKKYFSERGAFASLRRRSGLLCARYSLSDSLSQA
jgi:hypothetical protein